MKSTHFIACLVGRLRLVMDRLIRLGWATPASPNQFLRFLVFRGCPIFVYGGAIFALPEAFFFGSASATERTRDFCGLFPLHIAKYAANRCIYSTNLSIPFCTAPL